MTSSMATTRGEAQTSRRTELITPEPAEALAGLLDISPPAGDGELPALWHWIYLLERRRQSDLGPDGHPTHGIPAPPGPGMLRMFAGGRVSMHVPLRFGEPATRTTRVIRTVEKKGRSGPLTFVTVRSDIEQGGRPAISDEQDIVYRPSGPAPAARPGTTGIPAPPVTG
ncbi:MAG TPA: MaoC family dehydratase N-terminal domain-containing protein, partial [Thermopolyspora sp.]